MSAPGSPDVLTLAIIAYKLYDAYQGAQNRFTGLCADIRGLEITLNRLGNRLQIQEADSKATFTYDQAGLEEVVHLAQKVLEELQKKVPSGHLPRGLYRLKWSQSEVDSIRARISAVCSTITAFNSSLLLQYIDTSATESTQQQILHTLDDILISVQGRRRGSVGSSTLVNDDNDDDDGKKEETDIQTSGLWGDLVNEMKKNGISDIQIYEHQDMILQWAARAAAAGILNQKFKQYPNLDDDGDDDQAEEESWEVMSAVYGLAVVTPIMQRMFDAHKRQKASKFQFTATNEIFGGDSFLNNVKAFAMVWRKTVRRGHKLLYSVPQKVFAQEREAVVIDFDVQLPLHSDAHTQYGNDSSEPADGGGTTEILIASWHNLDVTQQVSTLVKNKQTTILANDIQLGTKDPCPGYVKVLSVTWAYSSTVQSPSQVQVGLAREGRELDIPPYLNILCANWGGLDITALLQTRITSSHQILELNTNTIPLIASPDPWPTHHKAISILFQYENNPLKLLVVGEGQGLRTIRPYEAVHRSSTWKLDFGIGGDDDGEDDDTKILAVIWGLQPASKTPSFEKVLQEKVRLTKTIPCTNAFFGGDGWLGKHKTCQVFLQNTRTQEIVCLVGREGSSLALAPPWSGMM